MASTPVAEIVTDTPGVTVPIPLAASTPVSESTLDVRMVSDPNAPAASTPVASTGAGLPHVPLSQVPRPHPVSAATA